MLACDAIVYIVMSLRSARLPYTIDVDWQGDKACVMDECARDGDIDRTLGHCSDTELRWRRVLHVLFECEACKTRGPRPEHLWHDIDNILPAGSSARAALHAACTCSVSDAVALTKEAGPWLTDPMRVVAGEDARVRRTVASVVAAYVLGVGAAVASAGVSRGHLRALNVPRWSRVRKELCLTTEGAADPDFWERDCGVGGTVRGSHARAGVGNNVAVEQDTATEAHGAGAVGSDSDDEVYLGRTPLSTFCPGGAEADAQRGVA